MCAGVAVTMRHLTGTTILPQEVAFCAYQLLLDDVRRELAVRHLSVRGTSAAEVAFLTGFSEPSAFSRAFRRWTGLTPGAYCAS